jgi:hypothetical protein
MVRAYIRTSIVKTLHIFIAAAALLALVGCGGGGSDFNSVKGEVSGLVTDINGDVVRGARVYVDNGPETFSNSSGAYVLKGVQGEQRTIRARIIQNGIEYYGEQFVRVFDAERSQSVNITVVRNSQRAAIHGRVVDRDGFLVSGARVFAIAGTLHSTQAVTNSDGEYTIDTLLGGTNYQVTASARGFNSDTDFINVAAGDDLDVLFTLSNPTNTNLPAPSNVDAVVWTSPKEDTRVVSSAAGIEAVKRMIDPRRPAHTQTRDTAAGNYIETDIFWDLINSPALLGYGIYRRNSGASTFTAIDFYRDPLAEIYEDMDPQLHEFQTYDYAISAINTSYDELTGDGESPLSAVVSVTPIGDLLLGGVTGTTTPRFNWQGGSGATSYAVYVFADYPGIGASSIWNSFNSRSTGLFQDYGGPALQSGRRYYYVVVGFANSDVSRTISVVDDFIAP